jgi:hypothetical protein
MTWKEAEGIHQRKAIACIKLWQGREHEVTDLLHNMVTIVAFLLL